MSPLLFASIVLIAGFVMAAIGVYLLFGLGWCLLSAGLGSLSLALILFRGLNNARPE